MARTTIVLNVSGGAVQDVYSNDPEIEIVLVDWDAEGCEDDAPNLVEFGQPNIRSVG